MSHILELTDKNFELAISAVTPTLVDFWAPWCGPCKAIAPILDKLSEELDGKMVFAKLNVDDHGDICSQYGVRAIPTMIVFKEGKIIETLIGMMDISNLKLKLMPHITPANPEAKIETPRAIVADPIVTTMSFTETEKSLIRKSLSELEAKTMENGAPGCCPEHAEGWDVRLDRIRSLLKRFA